MHLQWCSKMLVPLVKKPFTMNILVNQTSKLYKVLTYFLKFSSNMSFYLHFLQFPNNKKKEKVWEPSQLVLCNSSSGNFNSL